MKKVLFVAHVDSHIRHFHLPYLKYFKDKGYEVHVATSNDENEIFPNCDVKHVISFQKSPIKMENIKAFFQMKKLLNSEKFDIVHCHTPVGGAITRLACKKTKKYGTKILYTAHGFHFFKGSSISSWAIFYTIEKLLSKYNDVLITINHEDYELAKRKFKTKMIRLVHGVGVDDRKFVADKLDDNKTKKLRDELGLTDKDFILMYVAELNENKNQIMLINTMNEIVKEYPNIKLLLIGIGKLYNFFNEKIHEFNLEKNIKLLGYRKDVNELLRLDNLYVATSLREGLPINLVEAALCGCPILAKKSRGHTEIVKDGINGFLFDTLDELVVKIKELYNNKAILESISNNTRNSVKDFTLENAFNEQVKIYEEVLSEV